MFGYNRIARLIPRLKQPVQLRVNFLNHLAEVLGFAVEFEVVDVDDEQAALVVALDPVGVAVVEVLQVVEADAVFVGASAFWIWRTRVGTLAFR